jgi:hypothetical protein
MPLPFQGEAAGRLRPAGEGLKPRAVEALNHALSPERVAIQDLEGSQPLEEIRERFATHPGFLIRTPLSSNPMIAKLIAMRWSS